jgi:hypothetical protein
VPNVLIVGDSVSAGYISYVRDAFNGSSNGFTVGEERFNGNLPAANVQHGPDNSGGGNADGVGYGLLCTKYFVRTPQVS